MEIIEVRALRDEADDVAGNKLAFIGDQDLTRDHGHRKFATAEPALRRDAFLDIDRTVHRDPAAGFVLDVVLTPLEEIVITLAPGDDAVVVADRAQMRLEIR